MFLIFFPLKVVLAMRDLFQVVFELKKKEIELARQQLQNKSIHEQQTIALNIRSANFKASTTSPLSNKILYEASNKTKEVITI